MPHSDYECRNCADAQGLAEPLVHQDLPLDCNFCPKCGSNKGFTRIYAANVMGGHTRTVAKVLDENLRPMYEKDSKQRKGASDFARAGQEALEHTYEKASPAERAQLPTTFQPHIAPASQVLGGMASIAKADTRAYNAPMLKRTVRPRYER